MKLNLRSGLWVGAMSHKRSCESIFRLSRCGGICFLVSGRAYSPTVCPITRQSWNPMVRSDTRTPRDLICATKKNNRTKESTVDIQPEKLSFFSRRIDVPTAPVSLNPTPWVKRHQNDASVETQREDDWRFKASFWRCSFKTIRSVGEQVSVFFFWNPGNRFEEVYLQWLIGCVWMPQVLWKAQLWLSFLLRSWRDSAHYLNSLTESKL